MAEPSRVQDGPMPAVDVPKGGGALRGLGEKFAAVPASGTGSMSVPIPTTPGRSGFGPQLSLTYDSGAGNGPFGFGWNVSVASVTRKTDKGLPRYADADESDVYLLSGAEDLVPVLAPDGAQLVDATSTPGWLIHHYRPRIEGLFARIERWTRVDSGDIHWRSITAANVTSVFGRDAATRVADPADATRVFSWLLSESYDDKGNAVVYEYVAENADNVDLGAANERNRVRGAHRYVKRIRYGNRVSRLVQPDLSQASWLFEVVFDYDEGHLEEVAPDPDRPRNEQHRFVRAANAPARPWAVRPDPFSAYRAGFEIRTYRRCRRVLMFHHIPPLPTGEQGYDGLVRAIELDYDDLDADLDLDRPRSVDAELAHQGSTRIGSFLRRVTQTAYRRDDTRGPARHGGVTFETYYAKSLPPLEFEYSRPVVHGDVVDVAGGAPVLASGAHQWVDLHGEGLPGLLAQEGEAWLYRRNRGRGHLAAAAAIRSRPNVALADAQLIDVAGDGQLDVVTLGPPLAGRYEHDGATGWEPFRAFPRQLNRDPGDANLRLADLTGDGHADVLVTETDAIVWHPSLVEDGFGPAGRRSQSRDEESGPRLLFADGTASVYLADMSGDGLPDLVRVRNGAVCYWPNLGYGRFGPKVSMDNSPWFDSAESFDQTRVLLGDIDGSGTTDIIYLGRDGVRLYFNQSGNRLSDPRLLPAFAAVPAGTPMVAIDLLGSGTACLVWASPAPADGRRPLRYVDLLGSVKPHLLTRVVNNLGLETQVSYASSTGFYLSDVAAGRGWMARLPFPVHVVDRVETVDRVSDQRLVTRYAYHHGHYDGVEREFGGFAMVEQWDTEHLASEPDQSGDFPFGENVDASSYVPPVLTRTWYHTGAPTPADPREYYREPGLTDVAARALLLEDSVLPDGLTIDEEREARRALRGAMVRQEVYGLDAPATADLPYGHPYLVTEQTYTVRLLQPRATNRHAVFLTHGREAVTYHYDRRPDDPRVGHSLTLAVDDYGNVRRSAVLAYGRRTTDPGLADIDQSRIVARYSELDVTQAVSSAAVHRAPLVCETRGYDLTGLTLAVGRVRLGFEEVDAATQAAATLAVEAEPDHTALQKRLTTRARTYYRRDDLSGSLALSELESLALPFASYRLAFTPGLVSRRYGDRVTDAMLTEAGYVHVDGDADWWAPSAPVFYSPGAADTAAQELAYAREHFFIARRARDQFHRPTAPTESLVTYDGYDLLPIESRDALGNRSTAGQRPLDPTQPLVHSYDYRVMQATVAMDANRNRSAVAYDTLGQVVATAVMGKPEEVPSPGDRISAQLRVDLTEAELDAFFADPTGPLAADLLGEASSRVVYDPDAYRRSAGAPRRSPTPSATLVRVRHAGGQPHSPIVANVSYVDGYGREVQRKIPAEPKAGTPGPRWVGTGWTVFNNKGQPVREYEPFFTDTHRYESAVAVGVASVSFYDPLGRRVGALHPDHTWEKVVLHPWRQETWSVADTVLADPVADADVGGHVRRLVEAEYRPGWHDLRTDAAHAAAFAARYPDVVDRANQTRAAQLSRIHAATPVVSYADQVGRVVVTVLHNRFRPGDAAPGTPPVEEFYRTRVDLDSDGRRRKVVDPLGREVARFDYDLLGNQVHQASMEAGQRWALFDVLGHQLYTWDSHGSRFRVGYDVLRRPTHDFLRRADGSEVLLGQRSYGEDHPNAVAHNLRGRLVERRDQAGVVSTDRYDFKGNLLVARRWLARDYRSTVDWSRAPELEPRSYVSRTSYDALNRPTQMVAPHAEEPGAPIEVIQPRYNEANLLEALDVWLDQPAEPEGLLDPASASLHAVTGIDYDARGGRVRIGYGNGTVTTYAYDHETLRLARVQTRRDPAAFPDDCPDSPVAGWPGCHVQDLRYTHDPAGHITHVRDTAQQAVFFRNQRIEPGAEYVYDAIHRLIEATGREHLGQGAHAAAPGYRGTVALPHPGDGNAMARYAQRYTYDAVGNLLGVRHRGSDQAQAGWTRAYAYSEPSQLEAGQMNNRLTATTVGTTTETYSVAGDGYDGHGNLLRLPHLHEMRWDFADRLRMTRRQAIDGSDTEGMAHHGERTWYVYDSGGRRVRKVTERATGEIKDERIYLDSVELYRSTGTNALVRRTLHVTAGAQRIASVETRVSGDEPHVPRQRVRFLLDNHLGSAVLELDDQAHVVSYEEYAPYGDTTYQAVANLAVAAKRYRYTGKERDEETGLYHLGARYYAPWLARWVSADPAGLADGPNGYAYCRGDPVMLVDPSGANGEPPPASLGNGSPVGPLWEQAVVEGLGPKFNTTTYEDTVAAFQKELARRIEAMGLGSNRKKGTGIHYARQAYKAVRRWFGRMAKQLGISLKGLQAHHDVPLAKNPARALDAKNLTLWSGHAGKMGTGHYTAHLAIEVGTYHAIARQRHVGVEPDVPLPEGMPPSQQSAPEEPKDVDVPKNVDAPKDVDVPKNVDAPKAPDVPRAPDGPKVPKVKRVRGGLLGLLVSGGVATYVYAESGSVWAAGQTFNPGANTLDSLLAGDVTVTSVASAWAQDAWSNTIGGAIDLGAAVRDTALDWALNPPMESDPDVCNTCHRMLDPHSKQNRANRLGPMPEPLPSVVSPSGSRALTPDEQKVILDWLNAK